MGQTAQAFLSTSNQLSFSYPVSFATLGVSKSRPYFTASTQPGARGRRHPGFSLLSPDTLFDCRSRPQKRSSFFSGAGRPGHPDLSVSTSHRVSGRQGLSCTANLATPRPSARHPHSGMSFALQHPSSSFTFLSRMGAVTRGIAVDSSHSSVRLHSPVLPQPPSVQRDFSYCSQQRHSGFCATAGNFFPPSQRSYRGGSCGGNRTRLLQPLFPGSEERRRLASHSRPPQTKFRPLQREIQDVDVESHHLSDSTRRLVRDNRPQGCLFSHPGRAASQKVPQVRLWREGIPVQGPSLWPCPGTENVHEMRGCSTGPLAAPGHPHSQLSGRLAHSSPVQGVGYPPQGHCSPPYSVSRPEVERGEECSYSSSAHSLPGCAHGFRSYAGPFGSCTDLQFDDMFGPFFAWPSCFCGHLPQASGLNGRSLPCATPGSAPHETLPVVDEALRHPAHWVSLSPVEGVGQLLSRPVDLAGPSLSSERGQHGYGIPSPDAYDGCLSNRLGSSFRGQASMRGLDGRDPRLAHKLLRTESRLPGFASFPPFSKGSPCHCQDGQHGGSFPCKPARRFSISHPGQACASSSIMVSEQVPFSESGPCPRGSEPRSGFSIEAETPVGGLDVEPSDSFPDLGGVRKSGGGPLCLAGVIPMPALVLPESSSSVGDRCIRPPLANAETLRLPAHQTDPGGPGQSEGERSPPPSSSPILAVSAMVFGVNSSAGIASLEDSNQRGSAFPTSGQDLASSPGHVEAVRLADQGSSTLGLDLPTDVQETIASARALSTRRLYSSKWKVFASWCLARDRNPVNCPVASVLEFLQERFSSGAAATTLRVYVAAIAAHRESDEIPLGKLRLVSAFMRGVRRLKPVRSPRVPSWDLSVVLEGLKEAPFEPLESAPDRILTLKVSLLLALSSLKRVGDLQALSVSESCLDFAPGLVKVSLRPRPGYVPKVLSTAFRSQVVSLNAFHPPPFSSEEDRKLNLLCPVRSLKFYVDRSSCWRKSNQLLVCFGAGRRGLAASKQRISHWVTEAISIAYQARGLPSPLGIRAHSTRSVASSQALFRGALLEDICVAAGWSSPHTFVRFYNLDLDMTPGSQILSV